MAYAYLLSVQKKQRAALQVSGQVGQSARLKKLKTNRLIFSFLQREKAHTLHLLFGLLAFTFRQALAPLNGGQHSAINKQQVPVNEI
jgi:hypothetical protein